MRIHTVRSPIALLALSLLLVSTMAFAGTHATPNPQAGLDFSISANPTSFAIPQGSNATSTITVSSVNGFNGTVNLVTSQFCSGSACPMLSLHPPSVLIVRNGTATSILLIMTTPTTTPANYTATIFGSNGSLSHSVNITFSVLQTSKGDFSIQAFPATLQLAPGATGKSTIYLFSTNGFSGTVTLSTSPPPLCPSPQCPTWSISPTTVNLPANGNTTAILTVTSGTQATSGTITVTGTSGSLSHSVTVSFTSSTAQPDFAITARPIFLTIPTGSQNNSAIILTSLNGLSGTVNLSVPPPPLCPACTTWSISPTSVKLPSNGTAASTLTIFAGGFATSGNVTVTATSGSLTHSVTVKFAVVSRNPDFTITANPGNQILQPGSSANSTLILTSINGFNGTISLTTPLVPCFTYCWFINPGTVNLTPGGTASSTLTFTTTPQIQPGNYSITVSAMANGGSPSHSVTVFFSVVPASTSQDFTISASPTNITITAGSAGTSTVNVTSINNFAGTVFLTATVSSSGPTTNLNPANITLRGGGTANSTLTVSTTASTPAGFYIVTVTGNSPSIGKSHSFQVGVTVTNPTPPDFTITASPTSRSVSRSSTTSFTITITGKNGFNGTITLTTSISPIVRNGPTITLPSTVGPYSNSTLTVSAVHKTPLGSYTITITATSGSLTHSVTVTVTVTR